jgi:hypothetical protein
MKTLTTLLLIFTLAVSCADQDSPERSDLGCMTGIPDGGVDRVFIRCCTLEQYNAGSNVAIGGTASWSYYSDHEWKAVSSCDKCE